MGFFDGIIESVGDFVTSPSGMATMAAIATGGASLGADAALGLGMEEAAGMGAAWGLDAGMLSDSVMMPEILSSAPASISNLSGLLGLGTGLLGATGSYLGTQSANQSSLQSVREQMAFQRDMSNTAHQRETADLIAAGLNPMLGFKSLGASTPTGNSVSFQNSLGNAVSTAQSALNTYVAYKTAAQGLANAQANEDLTLSQQRNVDANTQKISADTALVNATIGSVNANTANALLQSKQIPAQTKNIIQDTLLKDSQIRLNSANSSAALANAANTAQATQIRSHEARYYNQVGVAPFYSRDISTAANAASNIIKRH